MAAEASERGAMSVSNSPAGCRRTDESPDQLLSGLLRCGPCNAEMMPWCSTAREQQGYRHYRCSKQQNHGAQCPTGFLPAAEIDKAVIEKVKEIAAQGELVLADRLGQMKIDIDHRLFDGSTNRWDGLCLQEQREILHVLIDRIVVDLDAGGFRMIFKEVRGTRAALPPNGPAADQALS